MKRKTVVFLCVCMAAAAAAGCGNKDGNGSGDTEAVLSESTEAAQAGAEVSYNVDDFVTLGDYMNIEISLKEADYQVTDEKVNEYVDQMIYYYKPYVPDETKTVVEKGDVVDVNYVGKKDGEAFEGGSAENQLIDTATNSNPTMGSGGFIEGFSDGLIGAKVGETVDWDVTFPEDYTSEELKGQKATFTFTINAIQKKVTAADMDDAFVKENFSAESVDAFYSDIRSYLEQETEAKRESDIRAEIINVLSERCTVDGMPEGLLESRLKTYVQSFEKQYCTDGTSLEEFLQSNYNMTQEDFENQSRSSIETSLKQELIFEAIAKKEKLTFDNEGFDEYVNNIMKNGGFATAEDVYSNYGSDTAAGEAYMQQIYVDNKACDLVVENATINYDKAEEPEDTQELESTEK